MRWQRWGERETPAKFMNMLELAISNGLWQAAAMRANRIRIRMPSQCTSHTTSVCVFTLRIDLALCEAPMELR